MRHELKTSPELYGPTSTNQKTVEVRRNDCNFAIGDVLVLREFNDATGDYTGASCERIVTHILSGGQLGIESGFVVMSLSDDFCDDTANEPTYGNHRW